MKTNAEIVNTRTASQIILAGFIAATLLGFFSTNSEAIPPRSVAEAAAEDKENAAAPAEEPGVQKEKITIQRIAPAADEDPVSKATAWLGVSATEASDALASQLDLQAGVGLLVTYVSTESPAAKAGLQKNDVLVSFEDQSLVHPAQLRKLVRSRKAGDSVKLGFYRAGKLQTVSVKLGKRAVQAGPFDAEQRNLENGLHELQKQLKDLHLDVMIRDQMNAARDALGNIKIDQKKVQEEIRHGMEEARKSVRDALKNVTNTNPALAPIRKMLDDLVGSGVVVDNNASVTVRSSGKGVQSLVNTDDSGTIVLLSDPKLHLTAHDKEGHLLFDGEIETADQRGKVPPDLWQRVEPLLDKMNASTLEEPEAKEAQ
jgi:membrane-associated protease RseP (regulator of RpoE activity)